MSDAAPKRSVRAAVCLLSCVMAACDGPSVATDAAFDRPDVTAYDGGADRADTATLDATLDGTDAEVDASPTRDDATMDAPRDMATDAPVPRDAPATDRAVTDTFTWDIPRCRPGEVVSCSCVDGRDGDQVCNTSSYFDPCDCDRFIDAGVSPSVLATRPLPPRLLAPQSVSRVTSQRPTLRWVAPEGASRVRVELCEDRPCTRTIASAEVSTASWRPTTALPAGPVFWRVRALDGDGGVTWASATWEFFVGHRDAPVDTSFGAPQDVDGDGYDDLVQNSLPIVGDDYNRAVFWGSGSGAPLAISRMVTIPASLTPTLVEQPMSDLNGDGLADPLFYDYEDQTDAFQGPWIFALMGGPRDRILSAPRIPPRPPRGGLGRIDWTIDGICDYDGDGFVDVAAPVLGVASSTDRRVRWVAVTHGDASGEMRRVDWVLAPGDLVPWQVSCAGDVNGDGFGDLLMGLYHDRSGDRIVGRTMMYLGGPGSMEDPPRIVFRNPVGRSYFGGLSTRGVGDLNGDGFSDLVVDMSRDGIAVYYGRRDFDGIEPDLVIPGPPGASPDTGYRHYGSAYALPADFNGDGYADLLLSAPCYPPVDSCGPGWIGVHHGGPAGVSTTPDFTAMGSGEEGMGGQFFTGDYNGDGYMDAAVQDYVFFSVTRIFTGGPGGLSGDPARLR